MKTRGFTIIEVILVLVLMIIFFALSAIYSQTSQVRSDINSQAKLLVGELRLLRSNAVSGRIDAHNGIKLGESSYIKFVGESFSADDPLNFEVNLPPTVKIQNINLGGEESVIIFSSPNGQTQNFGTFDLDSSQIQRTITINISQIGKIDY
jgi:type II secretory pathway pseudopilin PulG